MSASAIIADVRSTLAGEPVFLAGSLVASDTYGKQDAFADVDCFVPTEQAIIAMGQKLKGLGFKLDARMDRVWARWVRFGFNKWHTNSLKMTAPMGYEINLVYKMTDGHPTTSLAQVLESFDFGLLAMGYELESGTYRDLRPYLFPGMDLNGPLPMMPNKRANWRNGFISQYNGLREFGRYAKYHSYGYDLSLVKPDLIVGYYAAAAYLATTFDVDKQKIGKIYEAIAIKIEDDDIDDLMATAKQIDYSDPLDTIMEALE